MIELSVLIPSTDTRRKTFAPRIQDQVFDQYDALTPEDAARVEVLMLTDNRKTVLGDKRNTMVEIAQGRYVQFIDDDDRIEPDMLQTILDAVDTDADVITFLVSVTQDGGPSRGCRYSLEYEEDRNTEDGYERLPNHICVVKRDLVRRASFPSVTTGEDSEFARRLRPLLETEHHIPRVLYHYDASTWTTEAQDRNTDPVVDVVMMANTTTDRVRQMTQRAINTCVQGALPLAVNIVVMEQQAGVEYDNATVIPNPGRFHYNRSANKGARYGSAPWVMVANNDLHFTPGWLSHLLAANHPVVSPISPNDYRQQDVEGNIEGVQTGRHLSGWCFMITRELWEKIEGFDECVDFWCSDDVTIEQVYGVGVLPMLVPGSVVHHLGSVTLRKAPDDDLTWTQVHIFNTKYGQDKFADDPRFIKWKQVNA